MRVVLVDDEALARDRLRMFLASLAGVSVVGEAEDGESAVALVAETTPDLVILDIEMPGLNGLNAARAISARGETDIVFITAHEYYAPDAFDVDAVDYILKPVRLERLRQAVERARRRGELRRSSDRVVALEDRIRALETPVEPAADAAFFWVPTRDGQVRVSVESIAWIEAARDYVLLHTPVRSHMVRTTMAALEAKLAGSALVRVHRSAFARLDRVRELKRLSRSVALVLDDGAQVPVGPNYVAGLEQALGAR